VTATVHELACDYCGLPVSPRRRRREASEDPVRKVYCCSGCLFAASILSADGDDDGHARRTMIKLGLAIFFAMNVMVFSMALWSRDIYAEQLQMAGTLADALYQVFRYLALLFCLPVLLLLGEPLAIGVWQAARRATITTDVLLLLGILAAFAYSLWSVVVGDGQVYFDVASLILVFLTLGRWFEAQGKLRSGQALDALAKLLPETVHVLREGRVVDVPREAAAVGETLLVFPGERFAVDGILRAGNAEIDEQTITGESRTSSKQAGDAVYSGTLNLDGDLRLVVTAAAGSETVSRMLDLVRQSRRERGHYQRLADRITAWFVPAVAIVAVATAWWHAQNGGVDAGILAGLAVVLIACPCALGLATPMALWIALGRAARSQVLFRNGQSLEQLAQVKSIFFDKTGTLTSGQTRVGAFVCEPSSDPRDTLHRAAALATASNHCLAGAIMRFVEEPIVIDEVEVLNTIPGRGLRARLRSRDIHVALGEEVLLGNLPWLCGEGYDIPANLWADVLKAGGREATLSGVAWGGCVRGVFVFQEQLRAETAGALSACRELGLQVGVLTGDRQQRADRLTSALRVPVRAEQMPSDKVAAIRAARTSVGLVAMVGDGINDAPALAASDVGIAMGCGADLSRDAAAVCLLSNDLARVPWTIGLARQTVRIVKQNLCWAFSYNIIGITLAASGRLSPVWSAVAMVASSVFVVSNSLRLNRYPELASTVADRGEQAGATSPLVGAEDRPARLPEIDNPKFGLQLTP
jgi:heavy metal translocating P-type ATPase